MNLAQEFSKEIMQNPIPVMVTGVGGGGHGEQILKALRMASTSYEIVGCDMSPFSKGLAEVDHPYVIPPASDPSYIESVLKLCKKHNVKALFHGSEPELMMFSRYRDVIEAEGIFLPINPVGVIQTCMDKAKTISFLRENDFPYPETLVFHKTNDLEAWNAFPAIIKPSVGGGGSAHTFIVQNRRELEILSEYLLGLGVCAELIIQEYKGTPESEYTVGVLFDMDGIFLNSIAIQRNLGSSLSCRMRVPNLTGRTELGKFLSVSTGISQGAIGKFPEVTKTCEKIATKLGARGAINLQCRLHAGKVYVFEINPRFSGTTSLRAMVGYNEPDILIRRHVLNEKIEKDFHFEAGVIVRGLEERLIQ